MEDRERTLAAFPSLRPLEASLTLYAEMLCRWQKRINLVGASTLDTIWWRHFGDSIQLLELAPSARTWVDLGSGAGFPGMVVALGLTDREGASVTLVESDARKAAFLREVSRETKSPAQVIAGRAERVIADNAPPDVVTSRALASFPNLLDLTRPWIAKGTTGLFLAGSGTPRLGPHDCRVTQIPSRTGDGFVIHVTSCDSDGIEHAHPGHREPEGRRR